MGLGDVEIQASKRARREKDSLKRLPGNYHVRKIRAHINAIVK